MAEKIKSTFKPFLLGQQVWLEGRNLSIPYNKKITTKREGPFKIMEKITVRPRGWEILTEKGVVI